MVSESTIELRRAELRDVGGMLAIDREVYPTPWSREFAAQQVSTDGRVHLVAADGFDIVGHGGVMFLADQAHVSTIAVDPASQRKGLGAALLLALFRAAIDSDCRALTLEVRSTNDAALGLYRKFGLAPAGLRRGYYPDTGEDALVFWSPEIRDDYFARLAAMTYPPNTTLSPELQGWDARQGATVVACSMGFERRVAVSPVGEGT